MYYKNIGSASQTYYGVVFKPGDILSVPGYIHSCTMVRVDPPVIQEPAKRTRVANKEKPISVQTNIENEEEINNG